MTFDQKLEYGNQGEREVANLLSNMGYKLMPMYQFKNLQNSPKIFSGTMELVSPDIILFKNNKTLFVEVKKKTKWVKQINQLETGCDYKLYNQYRQVVEHTGINIMMVFNHVDEEPTGMYMINLLDKGRFWDGRDEHKQVFNPMYFYNYESLKKIT
jgi:hypothetical protein